QIAQEMPNGYEIRNSLINYELRRDTPGRPCRRYCVADEIALVGGNGRCRVWGMDAAPENLVPSDREALAWLAQLLLALAQERSLDGVLHKAIAAAAAVPGVALARVYLLAPGDICRACPQRTVCPDQTQCLHAAVGGGRLLRGATEEWSRLE